MPEQSHSHGYDYYDPRDESPTESRAVYFHRKQLEAAGRLPTDDPICWPRATALGLFALLAAAVFLAAVTFAAFEAGRKAEREATKAAAEGYLP